MLIVIDSYMMIKSKDNDNNDENNAQNKGNNKKLLEKTKRKYNNRK